MIDNGYIILSRQIMENEIFLTKPSLWFKLWIYILMKVNYTTSKLYPRGTGLFLWQNIKSDFPELTDDSWFHFIKWLKRAEMIAVRKAVRGLVITINNYGLYQDKENYKSGTESGTESGTGAEQERNRSGTITKECKNVRIKETNRILVNQKTTKKLQEDNQNTEEEIEIEKEVGSVYINEVKEVIEYLNKISSKNFTNSEANAKFIIARLKSKRTVEELKKVIDIKSKEWLGTKEEKYLRPETLFNATKFESYINQKENTSIQTKQDLRGMNTTSDDYSGGNRLV